MIYNVRLNDGVRPRIFCVVCNKPIDDATRAVAVAVRLNGEPDTRSEVRYAHKGACHDMVEIGMGGRRVCGFIELDKHLVQLLHNTGMSLAKIKEKASEPSYF